MSSKIHRILLIFIALTLANELFAQSWRLTPYRAPAALYLNFGRLYDYNIYEHNRFELGLTWVNPSENAHQTPRIFLGQWRLYGSVAYGTMDRELKYCGNIQLRLPGRHDARLHLSAFNELEAAASHSLESYQMTAIDRNSHYLWSRYMGVRGAEAGGRMALRTNYELALCLRQTWEDSRFDSQGLFYPALDPAEQQPVRPFTEASASLFWSKRAALVVRAGRMFDGHSRHYLSAFAQYDAPLPKLPALTLFAQAGYATNGTPYSRLFDISGTSGTPYFFRHTFLSVPPHTLVAHCYVLLFANYTHPRPLWQLSWSRPRPFAQLGAMYGQSFGPAPDFDAPLAAPDRGLAEASVGIDRLLHWGMIDLGAAAACQLAPADAPYCAAPESRLSFAAMATLSL